MHPRMIGLTGTEAQVKAASQAYRTYFKKKDAEDDPYFLIDHSTFTYLMLPSRSALSISSTATMTPEEMADRIACFVDVWKAAQ